MVENNKIILSVLVISHNQKELLPRCLDSILAQELSVPFEVIVSDDRSTDGTKELIKEYENKYPGIVKGVDCNSDECHPASRSERCGWNKANAYLHARGQFFVNIDADDYLKSTTIYQHQLSLLLDHPDCSMCQQRVWQVEESAPLESGFSWPDSKRLKDGCILDPDTIILNHLQGLNQTYMIRRIINEENPALRYGCLFDDTVITLYHLQYGNVVYTDRADYVWVQYPSSISNSSLGNDNLVLYGLLPIQHALLVPKYAKQFIMQGDLELFHLLTRCLKEKINITPEVKQRLVRYKGFIYDFIVGRYPRYFGWCRIAVACICYRLIKKGIKTNALTNIFQIVMGISTKNSSKTIIELKKQFQPDTQSL